MLLKIKKTGAELEVNLASYFTNAIYIFIGSAILCYAILSNWKEAFVFALPLTVSASIWDFIKDNLGARKHHTIITSPLFIELSNVYGFELERINTYVGLAGNYNNTAVRIYYDWNKKARNILSMGDLVIIVNYEPLMLNTLSDENDEPEEDAEKLDDLNKTIKPGIFSLRLVYTSFDALYLIRHINYYSSLSSARVISEIEKMIRLTRENNLTPVSLATLQTLQKEKFLNYDPPLQLAKGKTISSE